MTLIEAAEKLGTSPDNLRGAIKRGVLRARKVGRDWDVADREVERYRREHRRAPRELPVAVAPEPEPEKATASAAGAGQMALFS